MKNLINLALTLSVIAITTGCAKFAVTGAPPTPQQQADQLARSLALASGASVWDRVNTIAFTFVVRDGNEVKVSRTHLWNLKTNTDTVTVGDKPVTVDVCLLKQETPAEMEALKAWTNDSYWLTAPLKLFDGGVTRTYLGRREVLGKEYEVLNLSFKDVGMTPGDRYNLYVDPYTSLLAFWDYMPTPETTMQATWENYRHPAGLKLSTFHKMGGKTIAIENLSVTTD